MVEESDSGQFQGLAKPWPSGFVGSNPTSSAGWLWSILVCLVVRRKMIIFSYGEERGDGSGLWSGEGVVAVGG